MPLSVSKGPGITPKSPKFPRCALELHPCAPKFTPKCPGFTPKCPECLKVTRSVSKCPEITPRRPGITPKCPQVPQISTEGPGITPKCPRVPRNYPKHIREGGKKGFNVFYYYLMMPKFFVHPRPKNIAQWCPGIKYSANL